MGQIVFGVRDNKIGVRNLNSCRCGAPFCGPEEPPQPSGPPREQLRFP